MTFGIQKILVPVAVGTDKGNDLAMRAANAAMTLAKAHNASVVLLYKATRFDELDEGIITSDVFKAARAKLKNHMNAAVERLEELEQHCKAQGVETALEVAASGTGTAETICQQALNHDVDLIVFSSHGRKGLQRFMLGSVAEAVAKRAEMPVLILKGEKYSTS